MPRALVVIALLTLAACAVAPMQEMSDARQAVRAAHEAGADQHAPEILQEAEDQLDSAGNELHKRDFREARKEAVAAKTNAINAQDMAHAIGSAAAVIDKAGQRGVLSAETEALLQQAQQAAGEGDVQLAVRLANEARSLAEQDLRLEK
jgi:hypothetical protein